LSAPTWEERQTALSQILAQKNLLEDQNVQSALIQLQERENTLRIPEATDYADYYGQVMMTVLYIAQATNNGRAYTALLNSSFNAWSQFGQSLARDPQAFPWILKYAAGASGTVAFGAVGLLAEALRDMKGKKEQSGTAALSSGTSSYEVGKRVLLGWAQKRDASEDILVRLAAVRGLGTVGDASDLALLQTLADSGEGHTGEATFWLRRTATEAMKAAQAK